MVKYLLFTLKMTSVLPQPVAGHVVPGTNGTEIKVLKPWGWQTYTLRAGDITETKFGPPIVKEAAVAPAPEQAKPKAIGDEHHAGLMQKLGALIQQNTTQMSDALPGNRLWR